MATNPIFTTQGAGSTSPALVGEWYQNYIGQNPAASAPATQPTAAPAPNALIGSPPAAPAPPGSMPTYLANYHARFPAATPAPTEPPAYQSYTAQTYGTSDWNVDDNQLVETGVNSLISKDGEMMERARSVADGQMNARGLVNTSMGIGAAQNAVYDHAIQIAGADAKTRGEAAKFNAGEKNLAAFNNSQMVNRAREFGAAAANNYGIAQLGAKTQLEVAGIGAAASKYGVDVSARTELQKAEIAADSSKYGIDVGAATSIMQSQIAAGASKTVAEINRDSSWATANLNADTQRAITGMTTENQRLVATINADTQKYLGQMDATTKLQVQEFANQNQLMLNTNAQATSAFNQAMAAISTIQNNASMDAATKTQAIRSIFASVNSQFNTLEGISGLNIPDLLDFTGTDPIPGPNDPNNPNSPQSANASNGLFGDQGNAGPGNDGPGPGVGNNANGDAAGVAAGPM